jgi:hypothetical protein
MTLLLRICLVSTLITPLCLAKAPRSGYVAAERDGYFGSPVRFDGPDRLCRSCGG